MIKRSIFRRIFTPMDTSEYEKYFGTGYKKFYIFHDSSYNNFCLIFISMKKLFP